MRASNGGRVSGRSINHSESFTTTCKLVSAGSRKRKLIRVCVSGRVGSACGNKKSYAQRCLARHVSSSSAGSGVLDKATVCKP
jgi:hypothetical protein